MKGRVSTLHPSMPVSTMATEATVIRLPDVDQSQARAGESSDFAGSCSDSCRCATCRAEISAEAVAWLRDLSERYPWGAPHPEVRQWVRRD